MSIHISISAHIEIIVRSSVNTRPMFAATESRTFAAFGGLNASNGFAFIGLMPGLHPIITAADL
jgi:hypothetical protein